MLALAACGRRGAPLPPYDVDPCYPRHYPLPQGAKDECARKEEYAREHPPQPRPPKGQKQSNTAPPAQTPAAPPTEPAQPTPPSEQPQNEPATPAPPASSQPQ